MFSGLWRGNILQKGGSFDEDKIIWECEVD
jgi:hypothetical protein